MGGFKEIYTARQLSRRSDPRPSHAAAQHMVDSGKLEGECKLVYEALKRFPLHTARELSRDAKLDYIMISKRLSVLESKGYATRRGERVCTVSTTGLKATQWEAI